MLIKNKITKPFGPAGTTAGVTIFIIGTVYVFFSLIGILLIVVGAFIGFTYEQTFLDTDKRRIKFSNMLFGLFPTGKWIQISSDMEIGLENSNRGFRTYSRGMRTNEVILKERRITLYGSDKRKIGPIKKVMSTENVSKSVEELSRVLGLGTKSPADTDKLS